MNAVAYLRVSTEDQHLGPEAQLAAIRSWAAANGTEIVAVHEDKGVCGATAIDERPGLLAAIDAIKDHEAGFLVVAKRDRLARDVILAAMIEATVERAGARVASADGTGNGDGPEALLMRRMVDAFAEYERAVIRARTRAALRAKRAKGLRYGCVPYGFSVGENAALEPSTTEQAILDRVIVMQAAGAGRTEIARALNDGGHRTRTGGPWMPQYVARLARAGERRSLVGSAR